MQVKYRSFTPALNPRRTKLEVPGWGGERQPRKDGSMEQAWHCLPFSEGARYGIELCYPYENELRVSTVAGKLALDGDFGPPPEGHGGEWPPFRAFGDLYYTYQLSLDLKVEEGWAIRTEPHPRFYTDPDGYDPDCRPGAHTPMVADDLFPGVQIAARGQDPYLPFRASRSRRFLSCPRRRRSTSSRCRTRRPPSASCSRGVSFRAATRYPPRRNGRQPPTRFSTARIDIFSAPRAKRLSGSADAGRSPTPSQDHRALVSRAQFLARAEIPRPTSIRDGGGSDDDDDNDGDDGDGGDSDSDGDSGDDDGDGNTQPLPSAFRQGRRRRCCARSRRAEPSRHSEWDPTTRQMSGPVATC